MSDDMAERDDRFETLLPYYERVVGYFRELGFDLTEARDLAQEVFVRVYEHRDTYRGEARWNYLKLTAQRIAFNTRRDRRAAKRSGIAVPEEVLLELADSTVTAPDEALGQKETAAWLARAVSKLEDTQRICILMFYFQGKSYREVGEILGITQPALKSRLNAARARLKELLEQESAPAGVDRPQAPEDDSP